MVGKRASEIWDSLRGADRAGGGLSYIDRHQFLCVRRRAENISDDAVARGSPATASVFVCVRRAAAICSQGCYGGSTLRSRYSDVFPNVWISLHVPRNRAGLLSRQADHFGVEV